MPWGCRSTRKHKQRRLPAALESGAYGSFQKRDLAALRQPHSLETEPRPSGSGCIYLVFSQLQNTCQISHVRGCSENANARSAPLTRPAASRHRAANEKSGPLAPWLDSALCPVGSSNRVKPAWRRGGRRDPSLSFGALCQHAGGPSSSLGVTRLPAMERAVLRDEPVRSLPLTAPCCRKAAGRVAGLAKRAGLPAGGGSSEAGSPGGYANGRNPYLPMGSSALISKQLHS